MKLLLYLRRLLVSLWAFVSGPLRRIRATMFILPYLWKLATIWYIGQRMTTPQIEYLLSEHYPDAFTRYWRMGRPSASFCCAKCLRWLGPNGNLLEPSDQFIQIEGRDVPLPKSGRIAAFVSKDHAKQVALSWGWSAHSGYLYCPTCSEAMGTANESHAEQEAFAGGNG